MIKDYQGLGVPRAPKRVVKPHRDYYVNMPIMVCDSFGNAWYEKKKHTWNILELIEYLRRNWPKGKDDRKRTQPIMLVCENPERVLNTIKDFYCDDPEFNFKLTPKSHVNFQYVADDVVKEPKIKQIDNTVGFLGFRTSSRNTKYFHLISPHDFLEFRDYEPNLPVNVRLYKFGGTVRKFMRSNRMRFSPTRAGLSSQLLRDKRFYKQARRKVPKSTNEKARLALPGNFYQVLGKPNITVRVYVIDQQNAHHYAAETISLPNSNYLFGRGRFGTSNETRYTRAGTELFKRLLTEHGLFRVRAYVPNYLQGYLPPWVESAPVKGIHTFYLFSNEIEFAQELGVEIRGISYCWTSHRVDTGIKRYSQWAQEIVDKQPENKSWLKPLLLSAYGLLGGRPRKIEAGYLQSPSGVEKRYFIAGKPVTLKHVESKREIQSPIVNVIQRGMIEAHTRMLSIQLARKLQDEKHDVIGIHADAVIIRDTGQNLPILPPPWRVKEILHRFEMVDNVSYTSDERSIMPGRKRER